jgi:hypothetical protein
MLDYYDRLEAQLAELTQHGAHRRARGRLRLPRVRVRAGVLALAVSVLVVVGVAAAVLGTRVAQHIPRPRPAVGHGTGGPAVLRNIYPARLPAPSGPLVCETPLTMPGRRASAKGEARFYSDPPTSTDMFLTATGLREAHAGNMYAIWLLPAVQTLSGGYVLQNSAPPQLLGVIQPPVAGNGRLTIASALSAGSGVYKLLVTVQPRASLRAPGSVVLQGFINF